MTETALQPYSSLALAEPLKRAVADMGYENIHKRGCAASRLQKAAEQATRERRGTGLPRPPALSPLGADAESGTGGYRFCVLKVSQACTLPVFSPCMNQRWR